MTYTFYCIEDKLHPYTWPEDFCSLVELNYNRELFDTLTQAQGVLSRFSNKDQYDIIELEIDFSQSIERICRCFVDRRIESIAVFYKKKIYE